MAKVCFVPAQGTLAAYLTGEIDHHAAQALRREIDAQIDARMPELLTMDFSGVTFMDSSGVGLILGRGRQMSGLGGRLVVQNAPDTVRRMLTWRISITFDRGGGHIMKMLNQVKMTFASRSVNESFSRAALAAFLAQADPTVPQLADIKTAVSEAVTNCIVHAYPDTVGPITMTAVLYEGGNVRITISDKGVGIPDVAKAMEPMYTTGNPDERAGLGFAVMQSFMDRVHVSSAPGRGTRVTMSRHLDSR